MAVIQDTAPDTAELPSYPPAQGDPLGTPAADEAVLWQGRPDLRVLARTAFHTRGTALYFGLLALIAAWMGNPDTALFVIGLGLIVIALEYGAAWLTVKNTLYILTDARVIMRIGMAVDKRINLPLKKVAAAHLNDRGKGFGDIALEPAGEHVLSYLLLWPHARPLRFSRPQPMLRALPDAASVASKLAEATARYNAIERGDFAKIDRGQGSAAGELAGATA